VAGRRPTYPDRVTTSTAQSHPLAGAAYVQLTTFRRSGEPVRTPVWVAPAVDDGDHLVVITVDDTGKTKRLAARRSNHQLGRQHDVLHGVVGSSRRCGL